jgi:hypothetical protein
MFDVTRIDIALAASVRGEAGLRYSGEVRIRITPERQYPAPFELTFPFRDAPGLDEGLLRGLREFARFADDLQASVRTALEGQQRRKA